MEFYFHGTDRDVLILSADGGLNADNADRFVTELTRLVDSGARRLIVDCARLEYVSSYGIAILMRLSKRLREHGGDVRLAAVRGLVSRVITLCHLENALRMHATVDEAREAFRSETA